MRFMKKVMAFTMAVMLMVPSVAIAAQTEGGVQAGVQGGTENVTPEETDTSVTTQPAAPEDTKNEDSKETGTPVTPASGGTENVTSEGTDKLVTPQTTALEGTKDETSKTDTSAALQSAEPNSAALPAAEESVKEEEKVRFQVGDQTYTVAKSDVETENTEYSRFAEDGSYTIEIPAASSFPYEITFTYGDTTETKTFDTADSEVLAGGHTFKVTVASEPEAEDKSRASEESELKEWSELGIVQFNTGNCVFSVMSSDTYEWVGKVYEEKGPEWLSETYPELELNKVAVFEEDGSFTIPLEPNPFFPYEVQFTEQGEKESRWFLSPTDTVEVGGHTFKVSASFDDDTAVTQLSLEAAGNTIVVYPEAKEFTNDGDGISAASMLPLTSVSLSSVDLTGLTPVELTMVKVKAVLGNCVSDSQKIAWKRAYDDSDNYILSGANDTIDLSYDSWSESTGTTSNTWEMIVGDGDQLNPDNIRYTVPVEITRCGDGWLTPVVYAQDAQGVRSAVNTGTPYYWDYFHSGQGGSRIDRELDVRISSREIRDKSIYVAMSLSTDKSVFTNTTLGSVKIFEGTYHSAAEALKGRDVTSQVLCTDMTASSAGYQVADTYIDYELTMVAYNAGGAVIGCMPFVWDLYGEDDELSLRLYDSSKKSLGTSYIYNSSGRKSNRIFSLEEPYALNGTYSLVINSDKSSGSDYPDVTAVYVGTFASIAEASAAGAANIMDQVLGSMGVGGVTGYSADYSAGVDFTVFAGEDGNPKQAVYSFGVKTERATESGPSLNSGSRIRFTGLKDAAGNSVTAYIVSSEDDSYAENNFVTILVGKDVDLNQKYAPEFYVISTNAAVYAEGGTAREESGKTLHSFAGGPVQYTVSAEDGVYSTNYWVRVLKADTANGRLYISSLDDADAKTTVDGNGVTRSIREVMLDSYHDYRHDICLVNVGEGPLANLSAELSSDVLELDPYWTLNGKQALVGLNSVETPDYDSGKEGELANLAKLRLYAKEGVADGTDVSGTLTIKSGDKVLMVLTLTGIVGDPCIKQPQELASAVKYVPYGTMIQNTNKYSWIKVSYEQVGGDLPSGMTIKPNGELYGVSSETGIFTFRVRAEFEDGKNGDYLPSSTAELTLTVNENTNDNVFNESDPGYSLLTPIGEETSAGTHDFYLEKAVDSLFVSEGVYDDFMGRVWLNGQELEKGVDYTSESGSTRITISAQTMQNKAQQSGNNTIAAEFRAGRDENNDLKRTAQNFHLDKTSSGTGSSGGKGGRGSGSGGSGSDGAGSGEGGSGAASGVTLRGYLIDSSNTRLSGMTVELHSTPRSAVTAGDGRFEFGGVEYGQHELFVKDAAGNILASKGFELREGSAVALEGDVLTAPNGSLISAMVKMENGSLVFSNVVLVAAAATSDESNPEGWLLLLLLSGALLSGTVYYSKKKGRFYQ